MSSRTPRPRLALPFSLIPDGEKLHLIYGEDVRYSLTLGDLVERVGHVLKRCDGSIGVDVLLSEVSSAVREPLSKIIDRLYGERILVEGPVEAAHAAASFVLEVEGTGPLTERLRSISIGEKPVVVLCQDRLDYHALLEFNRRCLDAGDRPWLWATTGPASRGFVSPVIMPQAGPCLACLWRQFRRLSPTSALYDVQVQHGEQGGEFTAVEFPTQGEAILEQLVHWKVSELAKARPSLAVYRLHVLELEAMEVSVHRVSADPTCPECQRASLV